jgi:hypothetical protein
MLDIVVSVVLVFLFPHTVTDPSRLPDNPILIATEWLGIFHIPVTLILNWMFNPFSEKQLIYDVILFMYFGPMPKDQLMYYVAWFIYFGQTFLVFSSIGRWLDSKRSKC